MVPRVKPLGTNGTKGRPRGPPLYSSFLSPACYHRPKMSQGNITKSILVADDDLGFLFWASSMLAEAGYSTWPARTVTDGLKGMDEADFHLLVINPSLPGASDLVWMARRKYPQLKIALLSETGDAANLGADAVISKPANAGNRDIVSAWLKKIALLMSEH